MPKLLDGYPPETLALLTVCVALLVAVTLSFYLGWRRRRFLEHRRHTGRYDDPWD